MQHRNECMIAIFERMQDKMRVFLRVKLVMINGYENWNEF